MPRGPFEIAMRTGAVARTKLPFSDDGNGIFPIRTWFDFTMGHARPAPAEPARPIAAAEAVATAIDAGVALAPTIIAAPLAPQLGLSARDAAGWGVAPAGLLSAPTDPHTVIPTYILYPDAEYAPVTAAPPSAGTDAADSPDLFAEEPAGLTFGIVDEGAFVAPGDGPGYLDIAAVPGGPDHCVVPIVSLLPPPPVLGP